MSAEPTYEELEKRIQELEQAESERKRAEEALRESEVKLRAIFNQTYEFMGLLSIEGRLLAANDTALAFGGLTESDVLGKFFWETPWWTHDIQQQAMLRNAINRAAEGELVRFEAYHPNKDGGIDFADFSVKPIEDESGAIIFLLPEGRDITDRKQAEDMLRKEKEFTETALNSQLDTFFLFDATTGKAIRWNRAFNDITGYTDEEIAGMAAPESYYSPSDLERATIFIQGIMKTGTGTIDLELICKSGRKVPTEYNVSVIHDEGGIQKYIISIGRDITERKQTEELLKANIHFLESLETINQAVNGSKDPDQMLNNVIETVFKLFDCDRAWLLYPCDPNKPSFKVPIESARPEYPGGKDLNLIIPMTPPMQGDMVDALTADGPVTFGPGNQKPISTDTQKTFSVLSQMFMSIHPKTGNAWMFGMHQCSHARIWTDNERVLFNEIGRRIADGLSSLLFFRELTRSEEKYRLLADHITDNIWLMDLDTLRFSYVSPSVERITGYNADEAIGFQLKDILTPASIELATNVLSEELTLEEGNADKLRSRTLELEQYHKNGNTLWTEVSMQFVRDTQGQPISILGVTRDISDRKIMQNQLQKAQKMESLGLLAGGVAHDLNNILSGIVSYPELLLLDLPEDSNVRKAVKTIKESGDKAVAIVQDLLTVARGVAIVREPLNLNDGVNDYLRSPEFKEMEQSHPNVEITSNLDKELLIYEVPMSISGKL